jgi:hypothetical protein
MGKLFFTGNVNYHINYRTFPLYFKRFKPTKGLDIEDRGGLFYWGLQKYNNLFVLI